MAAAGLNALRQMYNRLGFDNPGPVHIVTDQGINTLDELENLDDAGVKSLCQALRKPGGTVPNPNAGAAGAPATVPNPGYNVSIKAEENLKLAAYYLRHQKRVSRDVTIALITPLLVRKFKDLKKAEEEHKDPSEKPTISDKNWSKTLEEIEEYLRNHLGHTKVPLSYIVRRDVEVAVDDPPNNYSTVQDEMTGRAPHVDGAGVATDHYKLDNATVWGLLAELTRNHKCWVYMKPHLRARDGRAAFLALRQHYLGANNVNNMARSAESKLQSTTYSKEGKRWNFETYVSLHKELHQILQQLELDHGYKGIDDGTKVRFLLDGIKSDKLNTVKAQIFSSPEFQTDFDRCVDLFKSFLEQVSTDRNQTFNVSRVGARDDDSKKRVTFKNKKWVRKGSGKGADAKGGKRKSEDDEEGADVKEVKDRYYTPKEYAKLTPGQREKLQKAREQRQRQVATTIARLDDMAITVAELQAAQDGRGDDDMDDEPSTPTAGSRNRSNPAL